MDKKRWPEWVPPSAVNYYNEMLERGYPVDDLFKILTHIESQKLWGRVTRLRLSSEKFCEYVLTAIEEAPWPIPDEYKAIDRYKTPQEHEAAWARICKLSEELKFLVEEYPELNSFPVDVFFRSYKGPHQGVIFPDGNYFPLTISGLLVELQNKTQALTNGYLPALLNKQPNADDAAETYFTRRMTLFLVEATGNPCREIVQNLILILFDKEISIRSIEKNTKNLIKNSIL